MPVGEGVVAALEGALERDPQNTALAVHLAEMLMLRGTVNQLLAELDNASSGNEGVFVLVAFSLLRSRRHARRMSPATQALLAEQRRWQRLG